MLRGGKERIASYCVSTDYPVLWCVLKVLSCFVLSLSNLPVLCCVALLLWWESVVLCCVVVLSLMIVLLCVCCLDLISCPGVLRRAIEAGEESVSL